MTDAQKYKGKSLFQQWLEKGIENHRNSIMAGIKKEDFGTQEFLFAVESPEEREQRYRQVWRFQAIKINKENMLNFAESEEQKEERIKQLFSQNHFDFDNKYAVDLAIHILMKNMKSSEESKYLIMIFKSVSFFKTMPKVFEGITTLLSQNCFKYEYIPQYNTVFKEGSTAEDFYIILRGRVKTIIPNENYQPDSASTAGNQKRLERKRNGFVKINNDPEQEKGEWYIKFQTEQDFMNQMYPNHIAVKEFSEGQGFGELALLAGGKRTATVISVQDTFCLTISKVGFQSIMDNYKKKVINEQIKDFRNMMLFTDCPQEVMIQVLYEIEEYNFSGEGEIILKQQQRQYRAEATSSYTELWRYPKNVIKPNKIYILSDSQISDKFLQKFLSIMKLNPNYKSVIEQIKTKMEWFNNQIEEKIENYKSNQNQLYSDYGQINNSSRLIQLQNEQKEDNVRKNSVNLIDSSSSNLDEQEVKNRYKKKGILAKEQLILHNKQKIQSYNHVQDFEENNMDDKIYYRQSIRNVNLDSYYISKPVKSSKNLQNYGVERQQEPLDNTYQHLKKLNSNSIASCNTIDGDIQEAIENENSLFRHSIMNLNNKSHVSTFKIKEKQMQKILGRVSISQDSKYRQQDRQRDAPQSSKFLDSQDNMNQQYFPSISLVREDNISPIKQSPSFLTPQHNTNSNKQLQQNNENSDLESTPFQRNNYYKKSRFLQKINKNDSILPLNKSTNNLSTPKDFLSQKLYPHYQQFSNSMVSSKKSSDKSVAGSPVMSQSIQSGVLSNPISPNKLFEFKKKNIFQFSQQQNHLNIYPNNNVIPKQQFLSQRKRSDSNQDKDEEEIIQSTLTNSNKILKNIFQQQSSQGQLKKSKDIREALNLNQMHKKFKIMKKSIEINQSNSEMQLSKSKSEKDNIFQQIIQNNSKDNNQQQQQQMIVHQLNNKKKGVIQHSILHKTQTNLIIKRTPLHSIESKQDSKQYINNFRSQQTTPNKIKIQNHQKNPFRNTQTHHLQSKYVQISETPSEIQRKTHNQMFNSLSLTTTQKPIISMGGQETRTNQIIYKKIRQQNKSIDSFFKQQKL